MSSGGDSVRMCAFAAFARCGMQACEHTKVPRALTPSMRSKRRTGVSRVRVRDIALALLTSASMPPKASAARRTASATASASRTSSCTASARPPAASTSAATLCIVPGSFGCACAVLPVTTILAPSRAHLNAISRPMPRLAPVMKIVFPLRPINQFLFFLGGLGVLAVQLPLNSALRFSTNAVTPSAKSRVAAHRANASSSASSCAVSVRS